MEAATWVGPNIMRTSKALGLRTEASARFEKQLHPEQAIAAQRLAARLMVELCGARFVPGTIDVYPHPAEPRSCALREERMERLLGEHIPSERVTEILERLGFERAGDGWRVPPWRDSDVQREADLIEEVARIHGLDKLPTTLPAREGAVGRLSEGTAPAAPARGPAARPRPLRVHRLRVHLAGGARAPAPRRRAGAADRQPAVRGPERDAPAAAARAARRRAPQRRARARGGGAVRGGPRLPARRDRSSRRPRARRAARCRRASRSTCPFS